MQAMQADTVEIWPEQQRAWDIFCAMTTQWRKSVGMAGVVFEGLIYEALDAVERRLPPDNNPETPAPHEVFRQLQTLEYAARDQLNQERP